jgi:hypothetical protein
MGACRDPANAHERQLKAGDIGSNPAHEENRTKERTY